MVCEWKREAVQVVFNKMRRKQVMLTGNARILILPSFLEPPPRLPFIIVTDDDD